MQIPGPKYGSDLGPCICILIKSQSFSGAYYNLRSTIIVLSQYRAVVKQPTQTRMPGMEFQLQHMWGVYPSSDCHLVSVQIHFLTYKMEVIIYLIKFL